MKWSALVAVVVVIAVAVIWATLFRVSDTHPAVMASLAGCYLPVDADRTQKVEITTSGNFRYRDQSTIVAPYEDKQSLSLLPKTKVVVSSSGDLKLAPGNPLLLRFDSNRHNFTVPSEEGAALVFQREGC